MNREVYFSKSLKGFAAGSLAALEDNVTQVGGVKTTSFSTVDLENVFIFSGTADDLTIGMIIPAAAAFTEITVGREGGPSGNVTFWGNNVNDFVLWDPDAANFYIGGSLTVRDMVDLGNLRIFENTISAFRPVPDGTIILQPQPQGYIGIAGNVLQTSQGYVLFNEATNFAVRATDTALMDATTLARVSTRNGNIVIANEYIGATRSFNITKIEPTSSIAQPNLVTVTTAVNHTLLPDDTIHFSGTTIAQLDDINATYTVLSSTPTTFTFVTSAPLGTTVENKGTVHKRRTGSITLDTSTRVNMTPQSALHWGTRAGILGTDDKLSVYTNYFELDDPIPTLRTPLGNFSDAGWSISYRDVNNTQRIGFFGFENSTEYFTWIPNATITRNADGTKNVSGTRGSMRLESLVLNRLEGDPDLTLYAPRHIYLNAGNSVRIPVNKPLFLGNATFTSFANGDVQFTTTGNLVVSPSTAGKGIQLSTGSALFFNATQTQRISGTNQGLDIVSNNAINYVLPVGSNINVPAQVYMTFGHAFQRLYGDNTGMFMESIGDINLSPAQPNGIVRIPLNTQFVFGDRNNYISGGGLGQGMTMNASGPIHIGSSSNITLQPSGGTLNVNAPNTAFPATASLTFGSAGTSTIAVTPTSTTINSLAPGGNVQLTAENAINLTAKIINVPLNVPLTFGQRASIMQTDTAFTIQSPQNTNWTTPQLTLNGNLQVLGTITYISTTNSEFKDPVISISTNPPQGDLTSKGIQFEWFDGTTKKLGAMYFNTQERRFYLAQEVTNTNEILHADVLSDLRVGTVTSDAVITGSFRTNTITGTPDLHLVADGGSIFLTPTNNIFVPLGRPIVSGQNSITATADGWSLTAPRVSIPNGTIALGPSTLSMVSSNNLRIGGIPLVSVDSTLNVLSTITFGTGQTTINVDSNQNMVLTSLSNIVMTSNVMMNGGMTMGNAVMQYALDVPGGRVIWRNTSPTTDLHLSLYGAIYDAEWRGEPIGLEWGGTGFEGTWTVGSVVFVESNNNKSFLSQNPSQFFWDNATLALGLRTATPTHTITVGTGNIDLQDPAANLYLRHAGQYAWSFGKSSLYNVLAIKTTPLPSVNTTSLTNVMNFSPQGIVGINVTDGFMSTEATTTVARLYVNGNVRFTSTDNTVAWSGTESISGSSQGDMLVRANNNVTFHAPTFHHHAAQFTDTNTRIYGSSNNRLHLSSLNATYFRSPHNVFVGRCCFYHDPTTDQCVTYATVSNEGTLQLRNELGDISIRPLANVLFPGATKAIFGDNQEGTLQATGNEFVIQGTKLRLNPQQSVHIDNVPLVFNETTSVQQTGTGFSITTTTPIQLATTSQVVIPDNTRLAFGSSAASPRWIMSDGYNLVMSSNNDIRFQSNVVRIAGDLIVDGYTTQRFFTETSLESGILQLGGSSITKIVNLEPWSTATETRVTTNAPHYLQSGDKITIVNSDPDIDGIYTVASVPTTNTFVIGLVTPTLDPSDPPTGDVRSVLTVNPNRDIGIQTNWHTGSPATGTAGARTGFFGVLRSSTNRFTYLVNGTNTNGIFTGTLGDAQFDTVYANFLNAGALSGPLNTQNYALSGSNFQITGGSINNTPIGNVTPSTGVFTNLRVTGSLTMDSPFPVINLNADMVDGKHAADLVWRDGTQTLTDNWNAGLFRITSRELASTTLNPTSVVFAGVNGVLTSNTLFTFDTNTNTLNVPFMGAHALAGTLNANNQTIENAVVQQSFINNSDMTLQANNTLDARLGTVLLRNGQLSGDVIAGGTAQTNITGNAATVTNGVYTTMFGEHTILKADTLNTPTALTVRESRLVGRMTGGVITDLDAAQVRTLINVSERGAENIYESGALMRAGNTAAQPAGGTMTGQLVRSSEYISMQSDQLVTLSSQVNFSFVSVNASSGSNVATLVLPNGTILAQEKYIIIADVPANTVVRIMGDILSHGASSYVSLWSDATNTSAHLVWNSVKGCWNVLTGLIANASNPFA